MACEGWNLINPLCWAGEGATAIGNKMLDSVASGVSEAAGKAVSSLGTVWVHVGTPNLTGSGGGSTIAAGSAAPDSSGIEAVLGYMMWISLAVAVISLFALGALFAIRRRTGEGIAAVGKLGLILGAVVLISGASALVSAILPSSPDNAGGAVLFLQSSLWWYMGAAALISVIIGGIRMFWEQRADPGRETVKSLLTLVVVAGAGTTIVSLLTASADSFAVWLLNGSLSCDVASVGSTCFGSNMTILLALSGGIGPLGAILIIILGLVAIFATILQILLMVARGGMLVILTGILPLSASFTNTEMGRGWFQKCVSWLVAFILYKPAAAIVYSAAFQLVGTDVFSDDGSGLLAVLTGLMLMIIALFAMPALMRFVTPMVGAMAGGAAGGALAGGALAALPSGATSLGRLASGGGSGSSGGSGQSGSQGQSGPQGSTGTPSGSGPSGGNGAQGPSVGGQGSAAPADGGTAAGAGATGGTAAGAAAGPVGIAAAASMKAGQAAAGAAQSLGEQSTGEGSGPDGSR